MKENLLRNLCLVFSLIVPTQVCAVLIDFEGQADGTVITNQYSGVNFSSVAGQDVRITTQPGIGFGDNFICTGASGGALNCTQETTLTFNNGVDNLSFWQVGDNANGVVAQVDVFEGGVFSSTVNILGFNTFNTPDFVDLTAFSNVSSIRIHSVTDPGGLGFDNFKFDTVAIPEPVTLALFGIGLFGITIFRRKWTL